MVNGVLDRLARVLRQDDADHGLGRIVAAAPHLDEFARIARFFAPLAGPGALGLADDVALIRPAAGQQLVLTTDAIIRRHRLPARRTARSRRRKLMRVNLSDLAAKGGAGAARLSPDDDPAARPATRPGSRARRGLAQDQAEFAITLLAAIPRRRAGRRRCRSRRSAPSPPGRRSLRRGAQPGDLVYVSGTIGDSALGLRALRGTLAGLASDERDFLADRYHLPRPRLALGQRLVGIAHAMLDVSDGLVGDLNHLCVVLGRRGPCSRRRACRCRRRRGRRWRGTRRCSRLFWAAATITSWSSRRRRAPRNLSRRWPDSLALPITMVGRIAAGSGGAGWSMERGRRYRALRNGVSAFLAPGARHGWSSS